MKKVMNFFGRRKGLTIFLSIVIIMVCGALFVLNSSTAFARQIRQHARLRSVAVNLIDRYHQFMMPVVNFGVYEEIDGLGEIIKVALYENNVRRIIIQNDVSRDTIDPDSDVKKIYYTEEFQRFIN